MSIKLQINGNEIQIPNGASVLDAINASGTYISQLCKDPDMKAIGACRTCLVEIEGIRGLPASCSIPATDDMQVWTETAKARGVRGGVLDLTSGMVKTTNNKHRKLAAGRKIESNRHWLRGLVR